MSRKQRSSSGDKRGGTDIRQQSKVCPACLRPFNNRRKWEARGLWPTIVYCSERCRRSAPA